MPRNGVAPSVAAVEGTDGRLAAPVARARVAARENIARMPRSERLASALWPVPLMFGLGALIVARVMAVVDSHDALGVRGDFLIRGVLGADRESGAVAIGDRAEVGATLQFQVRDADAADEDLRELLAGHDADGALLFTCNGRGRRLFGVDDHDAALLDAVVRDGASAGMFCAGELGPVGGRNFVHGFTASMILFTDRLG